MNIFDSAIVISAIVGGVMGGLVSVILTLGLLRRDRRQRGGAGPSAHSGGEFRTPSGPLSRRYTHTEVAEAQRTEPPPEA